MWAACGVITDTKSWWEHSLGSSRITQLTPALPVSTYWVDEWEASGLHQQLQDQVAFLPGAQAKWSCPAVPPPFSLPQLISMHAVRLPGKVRDRIHCNLRLLWWLWGGQLLPIIPFLTSASSHSCNPGAVSGWKVMLWPGRGHFVIWWKVGKRMWAAEAYKLVLLQCREPLLWSTCF